MIGLCVVYAIFEMREVYADQREKFLRAISSFAEFQKLQPQFISVLERIESDGHALQKIAVQVEVAVAALKTTVRQSSPGPPVIPEMKPEAKTDNGDYIRVRKEIVSRDPRIRFSLLKDWISTNGNAILYRASRGWNTAADLIVNVPTYLEAEAEVREDSVLMIGTRGCAEKVELPLDDSKGSADEVLSGRTHV